MKSFWTEEFASFTDTYTREATPAIQNKVGQFTSNPLIRNIVGQPKSSFDLRKMMDEKKIFIVNLSKGRMGETNAALLGSMLVVKIYLAAMSRADEPAARMAQLPRFYFYVDEFQSMMNEAFADILSESRKYKLALTLANQYIEQMEEEVRDAVFGNVGTLVCFRVGPFDAEVLETVFDPTFTPEDLVGLGVGQIYLTLMIDGVGSAPFSAETVPPIDPPPVSYRDDCIRSSRDQFSRARSEMESLVTKRLLEYAPPPKQEKPRGNTFGPSRSGGGNTGGGDRPASRFGTAPRPYQPPPPREQHADRTPRPEPARIVQPEHQRSALRDAINAARPVEETEKSVPTPEIFRSPADILRQKRAIREERSVHTNMHAGTGPTPPKAPTETPAPKFERPKEEPAKDQGNGEVGYAELQRILNGGEESAR